MQNVGEGGVMDKVPPRKKRSGSTVVAVDSVPAVGIAV
jgi:hypothetical protein